MSASSYSSDVMRALHKVGQDIRDARRRRRIPIATLAAKISISRATLAKVERGLPGVGLGTYATVLSSFGMIDRLADMADARYDAIGLKTDGEYLPQRIRLRKAGPIGDENPQQKAAYIKTV